MNRQEAFREAVEIGKMDRYCISPGKLREDWFQEQKKDVRILLENIDFEIPEVTSFTPRFPREILNPEPDYSGSFIGQTPEEECIHLGDENPNLFMYKNRSFKLEDLEATLAIWKWSL